MKRILNNIIRFFRPPSEKAFEDLFLIISLTFLAIVFATNLNDLNFVTMFCDKMDFFHFVGGHYHINSMILPPITVFMLGLIWYSWRRWNETKKSELELEKLVIERTSELQRFKDLIDQTNDSIIIADAKTSKIVEFNKRACQNLEYTKEELSELRIIDIETIIPTMRLWEKHVAEAKEKKLIVLEGLRKRKNGSTFPAEVTVNYAVRGGKEFMVGIIHDISDRVEAETALKKSEERFRSLTEASPDWIWALDKKGKYVYASPKIRDILGYEPEEIIGKTPFDLMSKEESRKISIEFDNYRKNKIPFDRLENINIHKDGHSIVLETSGVPLFDKHKEVIGWQGIDRDITERKKLEEEFAIQSAQMGKLFQESPEAIVLWDNNNRILRANDKFVELFGFSRQELIGKCISSLIVPKKLIEEGTSLTKAAQKGMTVELETVRQRKDKTKVDVSIITHAIKLSEKEIIVYGIYRDITNRKKMEKDLSVQRAHMEKLFQESPEAIALLDNKARIIKINKNYSDLFGYKEKEVIGKSLDDLIIPENLREEAISASKKITSGKTTDFESVRKNKKGQEIPVSILGHPIMLHDDQLAIYVIYRDISKQKQSYERLLESYKHLGIVNRQLEMLAFLRNYKGKSKQETLKYILTCAKNFSREKYILIYEYKDNYNFSLLRSTGCGKSEQKLKNISVKSWDSLKRLVDKEEYVFTSKDFGSFSKIDGKIASLLALPIKKNNRVKGMLVIISDERILINDNTEFYNIFASHCSKILEDYL